MARGKNVPIKYTNRDFDSIKEDLIEFAKRYYPDTYKDFTQASFGSMLFDMVAVVGDSLSFYLDYQANESFLDTAIEFGNIRKHAKAMGFSYSGIPVSFGAASFFMLIPSNTDGTAPDLDYMPVLKRNSVMKSENGTSFILLEDVDFRNPKNDIVEAKYDETTGGVTYFAVRAYGQVSSGRFQQITVDLTNASFIKFRKIRVGSNAISEIVNVIDSNGNKYYEVDYLSQEVVYLETTNPTALNDGVRSIMKPFVTARRFIMEQDNTGTYLQFGYGSEEDDDAGLADPSKVAIKMHARDHSTVSSVDPYKLLGTDKFGVSPSGVTLTITFRVNDTRNVNVGTGKLNQIENSVIKYRNRETLNQSVLDYINSTLEVNNEEPIVGQSIDFTGEELKLRAKNYYATQNRAVTKQDYEAIAYNMPTKFGQIKRVNVINDPNATNRRLAMYVISENDDGHLIKTNGKVKTNLKTWLLQYSSINDQIEIFDTKIVNFGIDFEVTADKRFTKDEVLNRCYSNLRDNYNNKFYIGEPIYINEIYTILSKTRGVLDIKKVKIFNKYGGNYSAIPFDFDKVVSRDNTYYKTPKNVVLELKFPEQDIQGVIK
tara:strand:+ start:645 stop:2444 length:1800 start_codon:yes stop_codon:yes gene_type:complete